MFSTKRLLSLIFNTWTEWLILLEWYGNEYYIVYDSLKS